MFDIGFSEIAVIAVVALVVLGPEKLPKTARTLGHLFGRLQRYVSDVKSDIKREIDLDELRKLQQNVQTAAKEIETSIAAATQSIDAGVRDVEAAMSATAADVTMLDSPAPGAAADATAVTHSEAHTAPDAAGAASPLGEPPRQASLPGFDRG